MLQLLHLYITVITACVLQGCVGRIKRDHLCASQVFRPIESVCHRYYLWPFLSLFLEFSKFWFPEEEMPALISVLFTPETSGAVPEGVSEGHRHIAWPTGLAGCHWLWSPGPLFSELIPTKELPVLEPIGKRKENMGLDSREAKGLWAQESPQPSHGLSPVTCRPCPSLLFKGHRHSP